jgi:hypothetical protein
MRLVVEPGVIELMVGTSSAELPLHASVTVPGPAVEVCRDGAFFSRAEVI